MFVRTCIAIVACLLLSSSLVIAADEDKKPAAADKGVPEEAIGFVGTLEGKMTAKKPNGNTVTLSITSATAAGESKAKDAAAIVGKDVTVKVRFVKADGAWKGSDEDTAFVKGLKKGDVIRAEVKYVEGQKAIAMTAAPTKVEAKKE